MAIEWTSDLEVGIEEIDNQHQELFRKINELLDACNQAKGREVVGKIIDFLGGYVVEHFQCEERYMGKYNYPEFKSHQAHHVQFIQSFGELKAKFETDGPGAHIVILANRVVVGWLNSHIRNVDRQMGAFLKTKLS
ncbi:MAG: bacteriohemerythrin [Firmicutes bacterium]|nr:bacteriohemerythrin [Bacillota bacterium]